MQPHLLTNFKTQKCSQNEPKLNGVYSRNNFAEIKYGLYVINLDEYKSIETCWIAYIVWHALIASELNIFKKKLKIHWQQKYYIYLQNTSK